MTSEGLPHADRKQREIAAVQHYYQTGDYSQIDDIIVEYKERIKYIGYKHTGAGAVQLSDAFGEFYLKARKAIDSSNFQIRPSGLFNWFCTIYTNALIDQYRAYKVQPPVPDGDVYHHLMYSAPDTTTHNPYLHAPDLLKKLINKAYPRPKYRNRVLQLVALRAQGLSYAEVAQKAEIKQNTAKVTLHRMTKAIKKYLHKQYGSLQRAHDLLTD